jgi:curved DNA-binding protein CbpA
MIDHYATLGVSPASDDVVIQAAYRALMRKYHPDTNPSLDAARKATEINAAYAVLGDPGRRAAYDMARRPPTNVPVIVDELATPVARLKRRRTLPPIQPVPVQRKARMRPFVMLALISFALFCVALISTYNGGDPFGTRVDLGDTGPTTETDEPYVVGTGTSDRNPAAEPTATRPSRHLSTEETSRTALSDISGRAED